MQSQPRSPPYHTFTPLPTFKQRKAHLPFQQIHPLGNIKAHNVDKVRHLDHTTL